jgi:hypothetical protein
VITGCNRIWLGIVPQSQLLAKTPKSFNDLNSQVSSIGDQPIGAQLQQF